MIKKFISIVLILCILFVCSGCSLNFFSVESLMSPPHQEGKYGEVEKVFKKLMTDKSPQLKTPVYGDYQTAYILKDVDANGIEEAFVFYTETAVDANVRMALLEYINDSWVVAADVKGSGNGVYDVSFENIDDDGNLEVLVAWTLFDTKATGVVSVYDICKGDKGVLQINTIGNEYYNSKSVLDFNGDGKKDIVLVYLDDSGTVQQSYFRCFSVSPSLELVKYSELKISASISSVSAIQNDSVKTESGEYRRVFIDCLKTDNTMFTELIYWNNADLTAHRSIKKPADSTLRSSKIICRDIDADGILEIPVNTKLCGDPDALTVKKDNTYFSFTMLQWQNAFGDKSEGNIYTVFNPIDLYLYRVTRVGEVTVRYDAFKQSLLFCIWDEENKQIKDELFSITYRKSEDDEAGKELHFSGAGNYYYSITGHGEDFGLTDEGIKSSFIIID